MTIRRTTRLTRKTVSDAEVNNAINDIYDEIEKLQPITPVDIATGMYTPTLGQTSYVSNPDGSTSISIFTESGWQTDINSCLVPAHNRSLKPTRGSLSNSSRLIVGEAIKYDKNGDIPVVSKNKSRILLSNQSDALHINNTTGSSSAPVKAKRLSLPDNATTVAFGNIKYNSASMGFILSGAGMALDGFTANSETNQSTSFIALSKGTGDAAYKCYSESTAKWSFGNDNTDAGGATHKFKIHNGEALVNDSLFTLDTSGNLTVTGNVISTAGTLGTGDITGVTLTGDSGGALADTSGSADFTIAGGTNCATSGSGSTITVNVDDAFLKNDADDTMAGTLTIDKDTSNTTAGTYTALEIDFDKTGVSTSDNELNGIRIDADNTTATNGTNELNGIKNTPTLTHNADAGIPYVRGLYQTVTGSTNGAARTFGINQIVTGGDLNRMYGIHQTVDDGAVDIQLTSSANIGSYCTIATTANGATTIETVDAVATEANFTLNIDGDIELNADGGLFSIKDDTANIAQFAAGTFDFYANTSGENARLSVSGTTGATTLSSATDGTATAAHITLDAGGDIVLDSGSGNFIAKKGGTEFSVANSAYAGMLVGYSYFRNTDAVSGDDVITIGTTMTVLQTTNGNDIAITFKAPPSGNVEIVFSAMVYGSSKEVLFALSDNSTYNELNQIHTYDNYSYKTDETDYDIVYIPWVLTGLTAGTSYTYYVAADSSGASSFIYHGVNRTNAHTAPIIVKATALPGTVTTGT